MTFADSRVQANSELAEYLAAEFGGTVPERYLGGSWFVVSLVDDPRPAYACLKGLHVDTTDSKKWEVSGCWPHDNRGGQHNPDACPKIGVSKARGKEALAAEIRRRLLPEYEAAHAEMTAAVAKRDAEYATQDANRETIAGRYGGRVSPSSEECVDISGIHEVRVGGTGNVIIKTYGVPLDKALRVLDILTEARPTV
jgi:hypothetical protein